MYMYVCARAYVRVYVCVYVCVFVYMYACARAYVRVRMRARALRARTCVCKHANNAPVSGHIFFVELRSFTPVPLVRVRAFASTHLRALGARHLLPQPSSLASTPPSPYRPSLSLAATLSQAQYHPPSLPPARARPLPHLKRFM